ncbi:hypothetical protein CCH79_00002242 [Gambusia affinis]|uniref:Uncharacterized protein n=1 Tax=Gambusia affinis TaxID=33528 RepID=A0A315VJ84_GAMAF|nr:hypothetical protein CCH79_00002242 [Gambusia affinis]
MVLSRKRVECLLWVDIEVLREAGAVLICCGEERFGSKGEGLSLPVDLRSYRHLQSQTLGSDQKNVIMHTGCWNEFPLQGHLRGNQSRATASLHQKELVEATTLQLDWSSSHFEAAGMRDSTSEILILN